MPPASALASRTSRTARSRSTSRYFLGAAIASCSSWLDGLHQTRCETGSPSYGISAYFIGDADTVATKIIATSEELGGVDRFSLQMTNMRLAHHNLLHGIELLGTRVAPAVREALPSHSVTA